MSAPDPTRLRRWLAAAAEDAAPRQDPLAAIARRARDHRRRRLVAASAAACVGVGIAAVTALPPRERAGPVDPAITASPSATTSPSPTASPSVSPSPTASASPSRATPTAVPASQSVAVASDGRVLLVDVRTGDVVRTLRRPHGSDGDGSADIAPDRRRVYYSIVRGPDGCGQLFEYDVTNGRERALGAGRWPRVNDRGVLAYVPSCAGYVENDQQGVALLDLKTGVRRVIPPGSTGPADAEDPEPVLPNELDWMPDGRLALITGYDYNLVLRLLDPARHRTIAAAEAEPDLEPYVDVVAHENTLFLTAERSSANRIDRYDVRTRRVSTTRAGDRHRFDSVTVSPAGALLFVWNGGLWRLDPGASPTRLRADGGAGWRVVDLAW